MSRIRSFFHFVNMKRLNARDRLGLDRFFFAFVWAAVFFLAFCHLSFMFRYSIDSGVASLPRGELIGNALLHFDFKDLLFHVASPFHWRAIVFDLCWVAIVCVPVSFLPAVPRRIVIAVLTIGATFVLIVSGIIYKLSGHVLSFSDFAFAGDGTSFMSWDYLIMPVSRYLCYFGTLLFGILAAVFVPEKSGYHGKNKFFAFLFRPAFHIPLRLAAMALAVAAIFVLHNRMVSATGTKEGGNFDWKDTYDPSSPAGVYSSFSDVNSAMMVCGAYQYFYRNIQLSLAGDEQYRQMAESIREYFEAHPKSSEPNEMTGVFEGKNCIGILLESVDSFFFTEDIAPNLTRLRAQGINFENHYTPLFLSAGTFNTEVAFNCGFYLPAVGTTAKTYASGVFPQSLPNLFRAAGYSAYSFHTLEGKYYNRRVVHAQWGYQSYLGPETFQFTSHVYRDTTMMQMYESFAAPADGCENFFSYLITYSGHGPYNDQLSMIAEGHLEKAAAAAEASPFQSDNPDTREQYRHAIAHVMECDDFVGQLVDRLEADGLLEDTVLVFFTDHYCKYMTDTAFVMETKGVDNSYEVCHTPFFIYSASYYKDHGPVNVTKATSSVDMLPTIANLFGLDYDPTLLLGADAFGPDGGVVPFAVGVWCDENQFVNTVADPEKASDPRYAETTKEVNWMLNTSWDIIRCNYFAHAAE